MGLLPGARGKFVAQADEIRPQYLDPDSVSSTAIFQAGITRDVGPSLGATISAIDDEPLTSVGGLSELATPWLSDQILPFDVTLSASNEYGALAGARILGVEILNEGTGVSIDDTVTETQATFIARAIGPGGWRTGGFSVQHQVSPWPGNRKPSRARAGPRLAPGAADSQPGARPGARPGTRPGAQPGPARLDSPSGQPFRLHVSGPEGRGEPHGITPPGGNDQQTGTIGEGESGAGRKKREYRSGSSGSELRRGSEKGSESAPETLRDRPAPRAGTAARNEAGTC